MAVYIKILCPGSPCRKCRRMIYRVEQAIENTGINAKIILVDSIEEMVKYNTWLLPSLIINDKIIARGYVPALNKIIKEINSV